MINTISHAHSETEDAGILVDVVFEIRRFCPLPDIPRCAAKQTNIESMNQSPISRVCGI
jgi:hypothetical protein